MVYELGIVVIVLFRGSCDEVINVTSPTSVVLL